MTRRSTPRRPGSNQPQPWMTHYVDPDNPDPGFRPPLDDRAGDEADQWLAQHETVVELDDEQWDEFNDLLDREPAEKAILTALLADDGLDDRPLWEHDVPPELVYPPCRNAEGGCRNLARSTSGGRCNRCDLHKRRTGREWAEQAK